MGDQDFGSVGNGQKRQPTESPHHQTKPLFRSWFRFLLLFCLVVFVLCYALSNSSVSWQTNFTLQKHYKWLLNDNNKVYMPSYRVHPKHRFILNEIQTTTESSTVRPVNTRYHQAYPRNYNFIMDNKEVCNQNPFLVLMVPVAPDNVAARDAIRRTWGKESSVQNESVITLFMLGFSKGADVDKLQQENEQNHDLIQSDFTDSYANLTIKTMVIMDWLATRCPTASYAMKVDSDMFLNVDNLVTMLQKPGVPRANYLTGMLMANRPVVRSKNSKWFVSEELYPDPEYPTYTLGMGYVFSNDLPERFVEVSKSIKPFNIEDAYIGMCMKKLGHAPTSPPDPSQFRAYNKKYNRCEFSKVITVILWTPQELINYWTDLKKPGAPC